MCISGIYSLNNEVINSTESTISTGAVDIELKEYNGSNEPFSEDGKVVVPGEQISLVPRVNNLGIECYLRMSITYTIKNEKYNELDYINGNYSTWEYKGGYYYYGSIFEKNDSIDLFNNLSIPDNLTNEHQGAKVIVHIVVEAIQAKNFDGNWNDVDIKKSIDRSYDINNHGESTVIYENNADRYLTLDDDFFGTLGGLLPGDSVSEDVKILNSSENDIKYYLSVESNDLTDEERKLLDNINLIIKTKDGEVLSTTSLLNTKNILLGDYKPSDGETLVLEISLPKKLDNEFSKILTKVLWKFSLETTESEETPNTGDLKFDLSITVFLLSAIGLIIVMIFERKENENIEK